MSTTKSAREIVVLCNNYDGSQEEFQKIVSEFVSLDDDYSTDLARSCEVAVSTVSRWVKGISNPHPGVRRYIVRHIKKILKR